MAAKGDVMNSARPPAWMTVWLQTVISARDQEVIAGDLLEEYREVILPASGVVRAWIWYTAQVIGFVRRAAWFPFLLRNCIAWLVLFLAAMPAFIPGAVAIFLVSIPCCGFFIARRSGLIWAGTAAALLLAVAMLVMGSAIILALSLRHGPPANLFTPVIAAELLGTIAAFLGRCTGERMQESVFPRF